MSGSEATEAAKRHFAHQHPDMADEHPHEHPHAHQPPKRHPAPTGQQHNYVVKVKVCNLIGLEAVCKHGRKAVKEKEAPERPRAGGTEKKGEGKKEDGEQHGTFVLSVVPHDVTPYTTHTTTHYQKSVGYQGSDPFHTTAHENILTAATHEALERKHLDGELKELHEKDARLRAGGARLQGERTQIEQYAQRLEQRKQALDQKASHSQANGNLGKRKAQALHKQRLQHQQDLAANNRKKERNERATAVSSAKQAQSAKGLSHFQKENAAHARFNLQMYTEHGEATYVDEITLKATMSHNCPVHPTWKVFDAQNHKLLAAQNGAELVCNHLLPPVVKETVLSRIVPHLPQHEDAYWLKNIQPLTYKVQLETCHARKDILIHVYPQIKSGLVLTVNREKGHRAAPDDSWLGRIEKYESKFKSIFNILKDWLPRVENLEVDILAQGKLNLSNTWEEEKGSDEVVWKGSLDADLDLVEASFRIPILSINPLPQAFKDKIGNFIDAGIYFTFDGKLGANFAGAWTSREGFHMEKGGIGGSFALGMEGLIAFGKNGGWGRMEANGTSTVMAGADVKSEDKALWLDLYWQFAHPLTLDFALFAPFDVEIYHWQKDLAGAGRRHALPALHLFGGGE